MAMPMPATFGESEKRFRASAFAALASASVLPRSMALLRSQVECKVQAAQYRVDGVRVGHPQTPVATGIGAREQQTYRSHHFVDDQRAAISTVAEGQLVRGMD